MITPDDLHTPEDGEPLTKRRVLSDHGAAMLGKRAEGYDAVLRAMRDLPQSERPTAFEVLRDYYCPRCGGEQPPGDCQCATGSEK